MSDMRTRQPDLPLALPPAAAMAAPVATLLRSQRAGAFLRNVFLKRRAGRATPATRGIAPLVS